MSKVVTRFAPSPTGKLHLGNIRTAVFAYLWAKHNNGKFLLRIEDTDRERFVPESIEYIENALNWLGLNYDGKKIYQSDRKEIHKEYAEKLVEEGKAYKCFCSKERLSKLRAEQEKQKVPPGYDGKCRNLSAEEVGKLEKENKNYVIRFAMPKEGKAVWEDAIRGKIEIEYSVSDDQVILKADGFPTYHLASIIDDNEAGVTDVIRGEEWISSTPKHLAIHEALGFKPPRYAHMPLIVGPDKKKLSKRHGDTAVMDYMEKGYLPETVLNFLALLGWNDGTEKELFSHKELLKSFEIERVVKAPAVFDIDKLNWLNGQYIRTSQIANLKKQIANLYPAADIIKLENFDRILEVEKNRLITLEDITKDTDYFIKLKKYNPKLLVFKKSNKSDTKKGLTNALSHIVNARWQDNVEALNRILIEVVSESGLSNGDVFWPIRVALSGREKSPSPAELLWVLGQEESVKRIKKAIELL